MQNGSPYEPSRDAVPSTSGFNYDRTPLHEAAIAGDEETLQLLLRTGADRNAKDTQHGNTPLHEAAWRGYSKCVSLLCALPKQKAHKILLDLKAQKAIQETKGVLHSALLSTRNFGGFSALHLAAQNGHNQSCREILLAGADPDVQNNYGDTPLHTACRYGHAGAVRILLSAKCDPQRVNLNGDTPLHIACAMGRRKLTRILLEGGCDKSIQNAQGETARDIAIRKKLKELIGILDKTTIELNTEVNSKNLSRDRSSSSSRHIKSSSKSTKEKSKKKSHDQVDHHGKRLPDPRHWSPYGCHYSPDPKCFPPPKLETLPKDPLNKGEQYYLDLAGNIRKGPVGVGTSCYCAPFFRHLEHRLSRNKNNLKKYVKKIDNKVDALAIKTDDQIEELTRSIISDRIRCEDKKLYLKNWLKRGILHRASLAPGKVTAKDYESATNTLTRSKSLEVLDNDEILFKDDIKTSTPAGLSRSVDLLNHHTVTVHRNADFSDNPADSSINSNCKNHPESDRDRSSLVNNSDKDRSFKKESSTEKSVSQPSEGRKVGKFRISKEPKSSRYKERQIEETFERDSLSNPESNEFDEDLRTSLVTKRLEKLLYETKSMLEKEKVFQKLRKHDEVLFTPDNYLMKVGSGHMINREKLIEHLEATRLQDFDDRTRNIEKEMELITRTLGGTSILRENDHASPMKNRSRRGSVMSPDLEVNDFKGERDYNTSDENEEYVDDINDGEINNTGYLTSTNFNESGNQSQSQSSEDEGDDDDIDSQVAVNDPPMTNGFFTNTNFTDTHNRSSSSDQSPATVRETPDICRNVKQTTEFSDASNVKELNELKSRILTGTNWRSKVLKVSADEARASNSSGSTEFTTNIEQNNFYDVRSSEVKMVKTISTPPTMVQSKEVTDVVDFATPPQEQPPALPAKGIVKRLISKIQRSNVAPSNSDPSLINPSPRTHVPDPKIPIPKDAYFHELPKKPLPIAVARNRNPLPIDLNENDILQGQEYYANTTNGNSPSFQQPQFHMIGQEQFQSPTNDSGYNTTRMYDNSGASDNLKYSIINNPNAHFAGYHQSTQGLNTVNAPLHIDETSNSTTNGNNNLRSKDFYLPNGSSLV